MAALPPTRWRSTFLALLIGGSVLAAPAQAQLFGGDDEARQAILKLRDEVESLRKESQRARIQLANQLEAQQRQINEMRGQVESLEKRVHDLQRATGTQTSGANSSAGIFNPNRALNTSSEEQQAYDAAMDSFRAGDYTAAATALQQFVEAWPNSTLAHTAQFYWGSSLYATKEYRSAVRQLSRMVEEAPSNPRAPDALLVIAGSQVELGERATARSTLQRIIRDYPDTPAAATARDRLSLLQ